MLQMVRNTEEVIRRDLEQLKLGSELIEDLQKGECYSGDRLIERKLVDGFTTLAEFTRKHSKSMIVDLTKKSRMQKMEETLNLMWT